MQKSRVFKDLMQNQAIFKDLLVPLKEMLKFKCFQVFSGICENAANSSLNVLKVTATLIASTRAMGFVQDCFASMQADLRTGLLVALCHMVNDADGLVVNSYSFTPCAHEF